ncbi:MAG: hypothetical protein Q4D38_13535 [Planctomycetia bacterium]|nr:hypothetical protein [Planctomycetia bacterium]
MINEALAKLKARINENKLEDEEDLIYFIPLASRMAALGDSSEFDKIKNLALRFEKFNDVLEERIQEGIWDVEHALNEPLGLSLIEAQDFFSFYKRTKDGDLYPRRLNYLFEEWWEAANYSDVDEEAAATVRSFTQTYPIPEDEMLAVVEYPVTNWEYGLLGKMVEAQNIVCENIATTWSRDQTPENCCTSSDRVFSHSKAPDFVLACDDGSPSEETMALQDRIYAEVETKEEALFIRRTFNERWQLLLQIENLEEKIPNVELVHISGCPFQWMGEARGWVLDIKHFSNDFRKTILQSPTTVVISPKCRIVISFGEK